MIVKRPPLTVDVVQDPNATVIAYRSGAVTLLKVQEAINAAKVPETLERT